MQNHTNQMIAFTAAAKDLRGNVSHIVVRSNMPSPTFAHRD
jgi:hypothetical protein